MIDAMCLFCEFYDPDFECLRPDLCERACANQEDVKEKYEEDE